MNRYSGAENVAVVVPAYNEEKSIARTLVALYDQEGVGPFQTVVVDNGSTDGTRSVIHKYQEEQPDFPIIVVEEGTKGTGNACRTGFDHAIEKLGATIVARTDADSQPRSSWLAAAIRQLQCPEKHMATGPSGPSRDEYYKPMHDFVVPAAEAVTRITRSAISGNLANLKVPVGFNTAITAQAYTEVGGYSPTSIDEKDEDADLALRVVAKFGRQSLAYDRNMVVDTSTRRLSTIGAWGMARCYLLQPDNPDVRSRTFVNGMDIR